MRGHGMAGNNAPRGGSNNGTSADIIILLHKTMNKTSKMLSDSN